MFWEISLQNLTLTEMKQLTRDEYYTLIAMNDILLEEEEERKKFQGGYYAEN